MPRYKVEVKRVVSFIVCVEVDCEENEIEEKIDESYEFQKIDNITDLFDEVINEVHELEIRSYKKID